MIQSGRRMKSGWELWPPFMEAWSPRISSWLKRKHIRDHHQQYDFILNVFTKVSKGMNCQGSLLADGVVWTAAKQVYVDVLRRSNRNSGFVDVEDNASDFHSQHQRMNGQPLTTVSRWVLTREERREVLDAEIDRLPYESAQLIRRHYYEGETLAQIAASLGVTEGTICKRLKAICSYLCKQEGLCFLFK